MDEQALTELLECSVCLEQLDDTSKVLPCQHTFCKRCLEEIVSTKHELRCPECRFLVEMRVEDLPSNILLIRLLEGIKSRACHGRRRENGISPSTSRGDNCSQAVAAFARQQQQRQASNSNRPCAKALFNYDSSDPGDLCFKKGDIVYLRKKVDENWFDGELNGQHGFFPANFVQIITALPETVPQCKGLYDFNINADEEEDCLPFKKEDVLTVIRRVDENWLEAKKGEKIGIIPVSFVELNDPAKILLSLTEKNSATVTAPLVAANPGPPMTPAHPVRVTKDESPTPQLSSPNKRHSLSTIPMTLSTPPNVLQRRSLDSSSDSEVLAAARTIQAITEPSVTMAASLTTTATTNPPNSLASQAVSLPLRVTDSEQLPLPVSLSKPETVSKSETLSQTPASSVADSMSASMSSSMPSSVLSSLMSSKSEETASAPPGSGPMLYIAMYNYKPQKADEIELLKGDYYSVTEKCLDGWFKGMAMKSGCIGVFPGNYVQLKVPGNSSKNSSKHVTKAKQTQTPGPQTQGPGLNPGTGDKPGVSPPRPKTSSSAAAGRSRSRGDRENRSVSAERNAAPPPLVPRNVPSNTPPTKAKGSTSSSSNPNSPILTTAKTTRYVRSPESTSRVSKSEATGSPVWKHSLSASANITPPNVVVGAGAMGPVASGGGKEGKEKKRDKEKISLMKRITSGGKLKKPKSQDVESASLSDSNVSHSRSGSYPSDTSPLVSLEPGHKKSGSFDSSSGAGQPRPPRPKPLVREKYRCIESYPAQTEIELDLKIGDLIYVHKKRDDGWFKGTLQRSGKTGLFPGSFVEKAS